MAHEGDTPTGETIDRSDRPGHIGLVLLLATILVGAILSLRYLGSDQAQPLILGLLAFFAMAGVFFLFAVAIGVIQFGGKTARNDITKVMADTSGDGLDRRRGRRRASSMPTRPISTSPDRRGGDVRAVERLFTGAPEVSEAIYRLAQAAREHRAGSEEIRLSPSLDGTQEFGWYRVRVRAAAARRRAGGAVDHRRRDPRARAAGKRLPGTAARDRLSRPRAGRFPVDRSRRQHRLPQRDARLLARLRPRAGRLGRARSRRRGAAQRRRHDDVVFRRARQRAHRNLRSRPAPPQRSVPAGSALSSHRLRPGRLAWARRARSCSTARRASTSTRASAPPRCASRASSTTRRSRSRRSIAHGRILQANAPFTRLFGTLPRTGEDGEGPLHRRGVPRRRGRAGRRRAEGSGRKPQRHPAARTAHRRREGRLRARLGDAGERRRRRTAKRRSSTRSTPPISARSRSSSRSRRR